MADTSSNLAIHNNQTTKWALHYTIMQPVIDEIKPMNSSIPTIASGNARL
ncbi:hypothetical protein CDL15_Pgr023892 [Punica granatum]|uniref:Uncharacterized protein n=1 Tax=Punica granatum TaxID=22663 RepID=A0A218XWL4_PUNGR|nr:hypothetical protein CDL15_Pgr023892 [Punica granatum]